MWWPRANAIDWWATNLANDYVFIPFRLYQEAGHLGVVIFFLISGFIISHVAQRESVVAFSVRRFFRVWPPMAIAIGLMLIVFWSHSALGFAPPIGIQSAELKPVLANLGLSTWMLGSPYVLSVTWSLFVELAFYVLMAALIPISRRLPFEATLLGLALNVAVVTSLTWGPAANMVDVSLLIYLPILIVGRCVYFWKLDRRWKWAGLAAVAWATFFLLFVGKWGALLWSGETPPVYTYGYAILIFLGAMKLIKTTPWVFKFFGDISYSLYLIHLPIGSLVLTVLIRSGLGMTSSFLLCTLICFTASWLSARFVEQPFRSLGQKLSKPQRKDSVAAGLT